MSPTEPNRFPKLDLTDLRPYLSALGLAERAVQEDADQMADRFEPTGLEVWRDARAGIRELRKLIRVPDRIRDWK